MFTIFNRENVDKLLSQAHETAFLPMKGLLLSGSAKSKAPFLMQLKSIAAIRETLMVADEDLVKLSNFSKVFKFECCCKGLIKVKLSLYDKISNC